MDEKTYIDQNNDTVLLAPYAEKAYLEYAISVVKDRALPNVSDGQKPVQRRILYTMNENSIYYNSKPVKSAKVVGETITKFHPHGDVAIYETMVRMAQTFTLRYPLVDGIGNFGSRDGDSPAAMRYTEARLTKIAEYLLLSEVHLGTVKFTNNYDNTIKEPLSLPARLPIILLNGASGIAVGMTTEIPSHNLKEVASACIALLRNPNLSNKELTEYIKGPDFANGGHIINSQEEILRTYEIGKGSVTVRARYRVENLAKGYWRLVIYELPPNTSAQKILSQIDEIINPRSKSSNKKISIEQQKNKSLIISMLDKVRDESDLKEPTRIVIEPKNKKVDLNELINYLMSKTDLETNVTINMVMIGIDEKPSQKDLKTILYEWITYRNTTVTNRINYRIDELNKRSHILEGRMNIFIHIDEVIKIIKTEDNPKQKLIIRFHLTKIQAEDILEIKLRQLGKIEWIKLEKELNAIKNDLKNLNEIINNEEKKIELIINEIKSDIKKFGDNRRTIIKESQKTSISKNILLKDEPITLILSQQGWIKSRIGHNISLDNINFKDGDELLKKIETTTIFPIILLDNLGKTYTIGYNEILTNKRDGIPINSIINIQNNANIIDIISGEMNEKYLLVNSKGYGFINKISDMITKTKNGKQIFYLEGKEYLLPSIKINIQNNSQYIVFTTSEPRILAIKNKDIKELSKGKGIQLIKINNSYSLEYLLAVNNNTYILLSKDFQGNINEDILNLEDTIGRRTSKGKIIKINGRIIGLKDI